MIQASENQEDIFERVNLNQINKETYISKYGGALPKDYNSALKKIENLHIALNKKVAKNKNQKEQINSLLKQKEELQNKLNQANRVVGIGIDNSLELVKCLDKKDENYKQLKYDYETLRLQSNKKMKDVQNDFMNIVDDLNKTIDLLEDRIKEKETIIKYLEGKLK